MGLKVDSHFVLVRLLLPLILLLGCLLRVNFLSMVYGFLLLATPFLPSPEGDERCSWWTRRFFQCLLIAGMLAGVAQLIFHIALLADPPYGHDFVDCVFHEKLARQFGFQRLDKATGWQLVRLIAPELLICTFSVYTYSELLRTKAPSSSGMKVTSLLLDSIAASTATQATMAAIEKNKDEETEGDKWRKWLIQRRIRAYLSSINDLGFTFCLASAGVIHPSFVSLLYFALFLFIATYWATNHVLTPAQWHFMRKVIAGYSGVHMVFLYLYQFEFFQEALLPTSFDARFLGFVTVIKAQCDDVRTMWFADSEQWPTFLNPFILIALYGLTSTQIRRYAEYCDEEVVSEKRERVPKGDHMTRTPEIVVKRRVQYKEPNGSPFISQKLLSNEDGSIFSYEEAPSVEMPVSPNLRPKRAPLVVNSSTQMDSGALGTVLQFATQQSYVASLFMMMAWSITYHSWSTFVLLLLACIVWMVPDSRKFCLKLSPFVAIYANVLLMFQFVFGLRLTQSELPEKMILKQIGLEKPAEGVPPCAPLMIKTVYSIMFWITFKQYLRERKMHKREKLGIGATKFPFQIAFSATHSGIETPGHSARDTSKPSTRSHSPLPASAAAKVKEFGNWARTLTAKYWVLVCCGLLLFISLRTPIVIYRILYMAFFLIFVNCFQISFKFWRSILNTFFMVMIVYCMTVLTMIYTYQFHGFPEIWHNGTGWSYDVLESLGLEQYSSGQLFLKLLTPISFLIFTIVQVNFFHKDLMARTLKLQKALYPVSISRASLLIRSIRRKTFRAKKRSDNEDPEKASGSDEEAVKPLNMEAIKEIPDSPTSLEEEDEEKEPPEIDEEEEDEPRRHKKLKKKKKKMEAQDYFLLIEKCWKKVARYQDKVANLGWRFAEIHIAKLIAIAMLVISVQEVSAVNIPYMVFIAINLPIEKWNRHVSYVAGVWTSMIIVAKMLFQMKFVKLNLVQCSTVPGINGTVYSARFPYHRNVSVDSWAWAGFQKAGVAIFPYLRMHILLIVLLAFQSVIHMRQKLHRMKKRNRVEPLPGVLFPHVVREDADKSLFDCLKYFLNFFFYKFGLEICFLATAGAVGVRGDLISILYCIALMGLLSVRRPKVAQVWKFYVAFLAVLLPIQYLLCVGLPPSLCMSYPWSGLNPSLIDWLFFPDFAFPPESIKLIADFFQLLCACRQLFVFEIELGPNPESYPGGSNIEIVYAEAEKELSGDNSEGLRSPSNSASDVKSPTTKPPPPVPVADFISYSKSYLDLLKLVFFVYLYWGTLAIVFVAGVSRVTLFAMGYVLACFLFLWVGNELFLKPMTFVLKLWNILIGYNVSIILVKTTLQVVGCVYLDQLFRNYCWVLQLFGIACLKTGLKPEAVLDTAILAECTVPTEEAGILFDGICFLFLLLQRKIFSSHYFKHVITEFKAQQVFASRGFQLISEITKKEIEEQQAKEMEIVMKIKKKMEKIKQTHKAKKKGRRRTSSALHEHSQDSVSPKPRLSQASSFSIPLEIFDEETAGVSLREPMGGDEKSGKFLPSPTTVQEIGVEVSRERMRKHPAPLAAIDDETAQKTCHLIGPSILPSPQSQDMIPFLTSPTAPVRPVKGSGKQLWKGMMVQLTQPSGRRRSLLKTQSLGFALRTPRKTTTFSEISTRASVPLSTRDRSGSMGRKPTVVQKHRKHSSHSYSDSSSNEASTRDEKLMDMSDSDSEDDEIGDLDRGDEFVVPESEKDRRKGLGPLQLLNVAFKRGALKDAVKESKEMEEQHDQLAKQMEEELGMADEKAIRNYIKRQKSRKTKADFEEDTFEEEHIGSKVVRSHDYLDESRPRVRKRRSLRRSKSFVMLSEAEEEEEEPPAYSELEREAAGKRDSGATISGYSSSKKQFESEDEDTTTVEHSTESGPMEKLKTFFGKVQDYLRHAYLFVKLFGVGVIESIITWLLKVSRDFRYVSHVLASEKRAYKESLLTMDSTPFQPQRPSMRQASLFSGDESMLKLHEYFKSAEEESEEPPQDAETKKFENEKNMFVRLFIASYYVLISRSELFCYLMMVLNHMSSASFLTMPLPVMAFLWGTLSVPRPSKFFWITVITFTEAMVIIKYLFQFGFFPWNKAVPPPDPFFAPRILGIEKKDKYAGWDLALLMVLFFHRSILKTLGLWKEETEEKEEEAGEEEEGSGKSSRRSTLSKGSFASKGETESQRHPHELNEETTSQGSMGWDPRTMRIRRGLIAYARQIVEFFRTLLNPVDRVSIDIYAPMFLCDFICFIIVIFGYWAFGQDTGVGGVASYFEENKVPGPFLAMLVVQFTLIIIDRALFLRKFLFGKIAYQLGLVIFVHIWMFFILPGVTDRLFVDNGPVKLWYFTKCIYFCLSAWQIRSGYPTRILGNFLTKKYTPINWFLFKIFMNIPFLFEIRALMDWIWTDTSMGIGDWLKMEDIYANVYQIKCERQLEEDYPSPRGVKKRPLLKYGLGGALLAGVLLIIWFPLVLFSLANTVGLRSTPIDCSVRFSINGYEPLYRMSAQHSFLTPLSEDEYDALYHKFRRSKLAATYMSDYSHYDVVRAVLKGNSTSVWGISPPSKAALIRDLNGTGLITIKFEWSFQRLPDTGGISELQVGDERLIELQADDPRRKALIRVLKQNSKEEIVFDHLFPCYVKVPGTGKAGHIYALASGTGHRPNSNLTESYMDLLLSLESGQNGQVEWWQVRMRDSNFDQHLKKRIKAPVKDQLEIYGFVDKVFPATFSFIAGGGILGMYVSLVLIVGKFMRMLVTGAMYRIIFEELPCVDRILQLCLDIFLVREAGELALEEDLFAKLIFLYRSPATLIKWTKAKSS